MRVADLKRLIENLDDDTWLEFRDVTFKRMCPINTAVLEPAGEKPHPVLVLSNRLPGA